MPIKILMPALSPTMTEGNLVKWHKKVGDKVKSGDLLAEIETDKATMEVEAVDEGIIGKLVVEEGAQGVAINSVIAVLLEKGEDKSVLDAMDFEIPKPAATEATLEVKAEPASIINEEPKNQSINNSDNSKERIFASPLAKRIASDQNINLSNVSGTGPHGRIVKADVLASSKSSTNGHEGPVVRIAQEYKTIANSSIRKVIARRLSESKQNIPHTYLSIDCNVDKLLELRHDINHARSADANAVRVSVNDIIIKAVALTLKQVPEANSAWTDEAILQYNNIDISVAVSIDGGLITPIIFNADQKSLFTISKEVKELASKARAGTLKPHEFQGGGFSISNLGMYGIKQFNAIVNPPQSCILAVGANIPTPIVKNNKIEIANILCVTLSSDHRSLDGTMSAKFLQSFKEIIENPIRLLLGY
jgi:pyruvate dehydrogenase E2 component (dihydrolipoamide acetyltransferase)